MKLPSAYVDFQKKSIMPTGISILDGNLIDRDSEALCQYGSNKESHINDVINSVVPSLHATCKIVVRKLHYLPYEKRYY
jgi:hypothetical protein